MTYDPLQPTPSYGCPYCSFVATSPNMRLRHLEAQHGETVDTSGAEAAYDEFRKLVLAKAHPTPNDPDGIPDFDKPRGETK